MRVETAIVIDHNEDDNVEDRDKDDGDSEAGNPWGSSRTHKNDDNDNTKRWNSQETADANTHEKQDDIFENCSSQTTIVTCSLPEEDAS